MTLSPKNVADAFKSFAKEKREALAEMSRLISSVERMSKVYESLFQLNNRKIIRVTLVRNTYGDDEVTLEIPNDGEFLDFLKDFVASKIKKDQEVLEKFNVTKS